MAGALQQLMPILLLLGVIAFVVSRLPQTAQAHAEAWRRRRAWNWVVLGLSYAMLYFGRYNLNAAKDVGALDAVAYGDVFGVGAAVYGLSFFLNGPLADRLGGRVTILMSTAGSAACNLGLAAALADGTADVRIWTVLYAANMYFQSFGAVSIVKVNAAWFHVRERGTFGGVFGILISLGIYFAFDWGHRIVDALPVGWVFAIPGLCLATAFAFCFALVRDRPSEAGLVDIDTGEGDDGQPALPALTVMGRMARDPVILTVAGIEFCSGFLRNAVMHWYRDAARALELTDTFAYQNWGVLLCLAGILGGMFAGVLSDQLFGSRRAPVAAILYALMFAAIGGIWATLDTPHFGWAAALASLCVIGVHGMLTGTASMDFGGRKNAGVVVGLIDGAVYFGTTAQSFALGRLLPAKGSVAAADPASWSVWPLAMMPIVLVGLALAATLWNAAPKARGGH